MTAAAKCVRALLVGSLDGFSSKMEQAYRAVSAATRVHSKGTVADNGGAGPTLAGGLLPNGLLYLCHIIPTPM